MIQTQVFYIGTSKIKTIRSQGSISWDWGKFGAWTSFKRPEAASTKKVKYDKKKKNKVGASRYGGLGDGRSHYGTIIPAKADRTVDGVVERVDVRFYQRGYTVYTRTSKLTKAKKMQKKVFTAAKPYQYRLQYKDKKIKSADYSSYSNGTDYIYFTDHYFDNDTRMETPGHLLHPYKCNAKYFDVRRNFDTSSANNNDGRDNQGSYVLKNVRSNLISLELAWSGLSSEQAADLLDTLNPDSGKDYLIVQYLDPAKNKAVNGTFYVSDRNVEKYPNGTIRDINVTLTEV